MSDGLITIKDYKTQIRLLKNDLKDSQKTINEEYRFIINTKKKISQYEKCIEKLQGGKK